VKRKTSRKTTVIVGIVAATLLGALFGYLVLIGPKRAAAADLSKEIAATEQQILEYTEANRTTPKPIRFAELFALTKAMPDEQDMPGVLLELSRVAADTGIGITSIAPQTAQPGTGYTRLPIDVVFEGSFYDLSDFLYRLRTLVSVREGALQANGRLFTVDAVQFNEGEKQFPQLQATLTLTAFQYAAAASAPVDGAAQAEAPSSSSSEGNPTAVGATN
jgi:Tfp pilus assembly protein PilO